MCITIISKHLHHRVCNFGRLRQSIMLILVTIPHLSKPGRLGVGATVVSRNESREPACFAHHGSSPAGPVATITIGMPKLGSLGRDSARHRGIPATTCGSFRRVQPTPGREPVQTPCSTAAVPPYVLHVSTQWMVVRCVHEAKRTPLTTP